ncbi:hypothetical protein [Endozoicomonas sp. 8E]|uniref:hypothetical protein n=1 Tax=Endozoicomonas sp. 8E TaxID=3035692 RepID=UPI0029392614|nr:hypothetical protein [Endozoicomonas sp. 8E]WOG28203.1 hypothetical protein P6910_00715 [Endozoicomonas sp. 8E]
MKPVVSRSLSSIPLRTPQNHVEEAVKNKKTPTPKTQRFFADHPPEFAAWTAYSTLRARVSILREQATVQYMTPHNLRLLKVKLYLREYLPLDTASIFGRAFDFFER